MPNSRSCHYRCQHGRHCRNCLEHATAQRLMETSGFLLVPELGDLNWTEFEKTDTFIKQGEAIVEKNIARLKHTLQQYDKFSERLKRWTARRLKIR